jgi:phytoene dehydrogenase-like protein
VKHDGRKIVIIGGGIAGLCAAVYAQRCGYQAEVLEMNDTPGGLATSWHRSGYTFENCLHWLLGSSPNGEMHSRWQEIFDIEKLTFVNHEEFVRLESEDGEHLSIYTNVDRMEAEMTRGAPQDEAEIRRFSSAIRNLSHFKMPDPAEGLGRNWLTFLHDAPYLPLLKELSNTSSKEYGRRFTDPRLRSFFGEGEMAELSVVALVFSLAWMNAGNAGYPIGGSQAVIRQIVEKLKSLGGELRVGAKVERILVERDGVGGETAVGVQLASGEKIPADWVISAADGYATIYELLGGKYVDKKIEKIYADLKTFPSYVQVSLGVARELREQPAFVTRILDSPIEVDPETRLHQLSFRFFHYDPTFAPAGKTAVTCFLPTRNYEYWVCLQRHEPVAYAAEKQRIADAVIAILERSVPEVRQAIEVIDVSTPATVIHFTGNWKGSMEGWLLTPGTEFGLLPNTLPGLRQFMMAGQWVMPGGGLPSGLMTARAAIQAVCKHDRLPFVFWKEEELSGLPVSLY